MVQQEQPVGARDLREVWAILSPEERGDGFRALPREDAEDFFEGLSARARATIILGCPPAERRFWMRQLAPDDLADVLQEVEPEEREELLPLVDEPARREVKALLVYAEDQAGGLMSPRAARVRPEMSVAEAISYLRRQIDQELETLYYVYVVGADQRLCGVVSLRELFTAPGTRKVSEVMETDLVSVPEDLDQESVARLVAHSDLLAVPVLDAQGRLKGIVTVDDIVDVVEEEVTEDMQKMGGMVALDAPYLQTDLLAMIRKRAGWLSILLIGQMFTASAMSSYQDELHRAVVLSIFIPLIIASGGNSGSQACTLVIRAMALGQVKMRDWYRIVRRELVSGLFLGLILAILGGLRIIAWEHWFQAYGEHYLLLTATVSLSLVGVVIWGTVTGSMLPFLLRASRLDPASAGAPLVATIVDVSGILLYFMLAERLLRGTLL